jgi:hypothetical protein
MPAVPPQPGTRNGKAAKGGVKKGGKKPQRGATGRPAPSLGRSKILNRIKKTQNLSVKELQKFLRNEGYNIAVDGRFGPQTKRARDAYVYSRAGPKLFNKNQAKRNARAAANNSNAGGGSSNGGGSAGGGNGGGGGGNNRNGNRNNKGGGALTTKQLLKELKGLAGKFNYENPEVNALIESIMGSLEGGANELEVPEGYVESIVGASYDPQIEAMQRELDSTRADRSAGLGAISDWFGGAVESAQANAVADEAHGQAAIDQYEEALQGLGAGLQGSELADMAAWGGMGLGAMNAINTSQGNFNRSTEEALQAQKNDYTFIENREFQDQIEDLQFGLGQLRSARGAEASKLANELMLRQQEFNANQEQAYINAALSAAGTISNMPGQGGYLGFKSPSELISALAGLQSMNITAAMAPAQIKAGKLGNAATKSQIKVNEAQIEQILAGVAEANQGAVPKISQMKPAERNELYTAIFQHMIGPGGNFTVDPLQGYNKARNMLTRFGGSTLNANNKDVSNWLRSNAFTPARLQWWNKRYPNKKVAWKDGKIVRIK